MPVSSGVLAVDMPRCAKAKFQHGKFISVELYGSLWQN